MFTKADIGYQLRQLQGKKGGITLVHTSMRAVGDVEGGAEGLLDVLIGHFTRGRGLLCIPAHTWHHLDDQQTPTLDMVSDDTCLGALSEIAIRDGRGIRTENPTHSMVVFGDRERALEFIANEPFVKTPTAPESCYGKLLPWAVRCCSSALPTTAIPTCMRWMKSWLRQTEWTPALCR